MSRNRIEQLSRRVEALEHRAENRQRRTFQMVVENHMEQDAEIARYRAKHGVTDDDVLVARVVIPYGQRPGETAAAAYQRELAGMANR
jgi:hypothetical protein